jgi:short-subunit dehydrogenase
MTRLEYTDLTVLVTGASSGIGEQFARHLAEHGARLVLVARRAERLESLATELGAAHRVEVHTVPLDLAAAAPGPTLVDEMKRRAIEVNAVINCAGFGLFGPFASEDAQGLGAEIAVDVGAVVSISHAFLDQLTADGRGFLINVASMAAYAPTPFLSVYGAAKAFVLSFTEALWYESRDSSLRVLCLSPGTTDTEFFDGTGHGATGGRTLVPPRAVVDAAFAALQRRRPPPSVTVGVVNTLSVTFGRLLSRRVAVTVMGRLNARGVKHDSPAALPTGVPVADDPRCPSGGR